uniref:Ig-like domain-containing protein n=1 Tax=Oncorhynchus tshawytscha TaxID=74940 RepID=A0AAZ3NW26_ONCTS
MNTLHWIRGMLVVIQSPHNVTVTAGDTVQIQCCWNQHVSRGTVNWHEEGHIEIKYKSVLVNNSQCYDRASQQTVTCNCSNWTISNFTRNDSGTYICKATKEIPSLIESVGDGTQITVTCVIRRSPQRVCVSCDSHALGVSVEGEATAPEG